MYTFKQIIMNPFFFFHFRCERIALCVFVEVLITPASGAGNFRPGSTAPAAERNVQMPLDRRCLACGREGSGGLPEDAEGYGPLTL